MYDLPDKFNNFKLHKVDLPSVNNRTKCSLLITEFCIFKIFKFGNFFHRFTNNSELKLLVLYKFSFSNLLHSKMACEQYRVNSCATHCPKFPIVRRKKKSSHSRQIKIPLAGQIALFRVCQV